MGSIFDPFGNGSLVHNLIRLVRSPRVQHTANALRGQLPMAAQPMRLPASSGYHSTGNSPSYSGVGASVGNTMNHLGSLLSKGARQPQQQQSDPLMDLYAELINQLQQPVNMPTGINTADLMNQVKKAINPIYDARIQSAEKGTTRARGEVKDMYRALSNDYERLAPQQIKQAKAAQEEVEQLYGQLRTNIEGNYARVSDEQAELFKSLGIEAALPSVLDEQDDAVLDSDRAAAELEAQNKQRYMDMGQIDSTYYREGSPNATMTGNEISTDLLYQLQDYVAQANAERSAGIQSGYMDQLNSAQSQLAQMQQNAQQEAGRRQGMLFDMLQSQMSAKGSQTALTPDTFMGGLPPNVQQSVGGAFTRLQRSPEAVYGKVEDKRNPVPGSFVETTPNWYLAQADEMLKRGEIDQTTYQALQMYMQLYFGMGK